MLSMLRISKYAQVVMNVHDQVVVQVPELEVAIFVDKMRPAFIS